MQVLRHVHDHSFISDGLNLTPADMTRLARSPRTELTGAAIYTAAISPEALRCVERSRAVVDKIVSQGKVVYGITTGFGAFKDRVIPLEDLAQLQVNLILSQCVGVGPPLPTEVVRAMMLCRAHTLSLGYSGIRPQTLQLLYDMLNMGIHPRIPEQGSVGASGDLAPLSHMAFAMLGGGQVEWRGEIIPAAEALRGVGLEPATLGPKEGLALSNGTSLMSALLSLALCDAAMLCETADVVGAMSLEAMQGVPTAFDPRIHAARRHPGQITSAARIRQLTHGSTLLQGSLELSGLSSESADDLQLKIENAKPKGPLKVQDAYSLRGMPQVHGPVRHAVDHVTEVLMAELNSANDNPLIFAKEEDDADDNSSVLSSGDAVLSGGNFHGAPLSVAADFLAIAVCQLGTISERRQARLVDVTAHGGLFPAFLIDNGGLNSGFMMVQYTSAALASENKSLAHPGSVDTVPTSANVEDHVSMGPISARHARAIVANTARILALECLMAAQAIDFRLRSNPDARMGRGTRAAYDLVRQHVPFLDRDRDFQPYIAAAEALVSSGALARVLEDEGLGS